jgi:UDP-glucose 4-epimerase
VVDLAVGHLKALEFAKDKEGVEAINLGTGNGISVLELVNAFNKANDMDLPYVIGPRRDGDLPAFWADAAKAKALLGWEATHTVEDMCRSAWTFAKNAGSQE